MPDKAAQQSSGGQNTGAIAAGSGAADVLVYTGPGRVCRLFCRAAGTAVLELYDGLTSAGGTLLFSTPATPAIGTIFVLDIPFLVGLVAKQASGSASALVTYNKDTPNGR